MNKMSCKQGARWRFFLLAVILFCFMSCDRKGVIRSVNLSKYADYIINNIDTHEVEINVDTITIVEVDKRRGGLIISPDEIDVVIELSIYNKMEEDFVFHIRNKDDLSSTYIFGYVKSLNDSISFVNQFLADSVIIHSGEIFKGSFESYLYDFEGLFPVKEDYTMEMIEIINKMKFKYLVCQDTFEYINFTPNTETLLIGKNTK